MKTQTNATPVVTKMDIARTLFATVNGRGYDLKGNTQRAAFIELAQSEGLSKHCAGTYYQNLSNQARGLKLYKYNKPTKKTVKEAEAEVVAAITLPAERWMVVDGAGVEVNSFPSRQKAIDFSKSVGGKWMDRSKAA